MVKGTKGGLCLRAGRAHLYGLRHRSGLRSRPVITGMGPGSQLGAALVDLLVAATLISILSTSVFSCFWQYNRYVRLSRGWAEACGVAAHVLDTLTFGSWQQLTNHFVVSSTWTTNIVWTSNTYTVECQLKKFGGPEAYGETLRTLRVFVQWQDGSVTKELRFDKTVSPFLYAN